MTRRNDRTLRAGIGSWVKNGDRWRVVEVHPDGAVLVERHRDGRGSKPAHLTLPGGYVAEHVQLGYASTIHGAQGATVDTTHTVLTGAETRQALYVALSRGRRTNRLNLGAPTASLDGVGPKVEDTALEPRQVLTVLARDGRALSATTVERGDAAQLLRQAVLAYQDVIPVLAQERLGAERMAELDDALERRLPGLTGQPAFPHLRGPACAALGRQDPAPVRGRAGHLVPRHPVPQRGRRPGGRPRLAHQRDHPTVSPGRAPDGGSRGLSRLTAHDVVRRRVDRSWLVLASPTSRSRTPAVRRPSPVEGDSRTTGETSGDTAGRRS